MIASDSERLLRPAQVAEILGVSRSKAYSLIQSGRIPAVRVTGSVRVPHRALMAWIAAQTTQPAA